MSDEEKSKYEVVIGLEVHAHLATRSKMFCSCPLKYGGEPNTATCPVCAGMPGVLPVINQEAVRYALKTAIALNCTIPPVTHFDRKNYYYPDLPKNYQISQNYTPLGRDGWMEVNVRRTERVWPTGSGVPGDYDTMGTRRLVDFESKHIGIDNVHLEEDAGKSVHPETATGGTTGIDLNRAGTPLLEIVSKPDMRSVEELEVFIQDLRKLLRYLGVSECKMEEGQLRFEVSISVRPHGQKELGVRVEVKNLNSVRSVLAACEYEVERQTNRLDAGNPVAMETRLWDELLTETRAMRSKELAHDYRYFPEPDLVPIEIPNALVQELRAEVEEQTPKARRRRFVELAEGAGWCQPEVRDSTLDSPIGPADAAFLLSELSEGPEALEYGQAMVVAGADPRVVRDWIANAVLRECKARGLTIADFPVAAEQSAKLLELISKGTITHGIAREVFAQMVEAGGGDPEQIVREKGLAQITDSAELERVVAEVIAENPKPVADFKAGKKQAVGALVGQVMRATKGKANPQLVRQLLEKHLAEAP